MNDSELATGYLGQTDPVTDCSGWPRLDVTMATRTQTSTTLHQEHGMSYDVQGGPKSNPLQNCR